MRVLLLHPEDVPWRGEWAGHRWDLIVDQGYASSYTYEEWSRRLGTKILSIYQFDPQTEGYRWVNWVFEQGRGRLLDRMGIDWWEILAMEGHQRLHLFYFFNQLRSEIVGDKIELAASRPHLFTRILEQTSGKSVHYFQSASRGPVGRAALMLRSVGELRPSQVAEIVFDKWDPGYRLRRHFTQQRRAKLTDSAVLLPSAYSNVTRCALAYAAQLPHRRFLLTTTRRSALPDRVPDNVTTSPLAAYVVPLRALQTEQAELLKAWQDFRSTMRSEVEEFRRAADAGLWDYFPAHLQHGLRLREAWRRLLDSEPIRGVLCGDDLNYHTRLPLILAHRRNLNAVYCSHGALDAGFLFKKPLADSFLVKGEMESDYLQFVSAVEPERVLVGAPGRNIYADTEDRSSEKLIFFSQPYEVEGGRANEIYRELLPPLCSAARRSGRKLAVKLHPFESKRARSRLAASILPPDVYNEVEIVSGVPPEEVIARTWCGVTVDSSVAVECALRGKPSFLCGWLDFGGMGYLQQFARYAVGRLLNRPESLEHIPEMVAEYRADPAAIKRLWHEVDPMQLEGLLFGQHPVRFPDPCVY